MKHISHLYEIYYDGEKVGETVAVSEKEACRNYWWKYDKEYDPYTVTDCRPEDYEAFVKNSKWEEEMEAYRRECAEREKVPHQMTVNELIKEIRI